MTHKLPDYLPSITDSAKQMANVLPSTKLRPGVTYTALAALAEELAIHGLINYGEGPWPKAAAELMNNLVGAIVPGLDIASGRDEAYERGLVEGRSTSLVDVPEPSDYEIRKDALQQTTLALQPLDHRATDAEIDRYADMSERLAGRFEMHLSGIEE